MSFDAFTTSYHYIWIIISVGLGVLWYFPSKNAQWKRCKLSFTRAIIFRSFFLILIPQLLYFQLTVGGNSPQLKILLICYSGIALFFAFAPLIIVLGSVDDDKRESLILEEDSNIFRIWAESLLGRHQIFKNSHRNVVIYETLYTVSTFMGLVLLIVAILSFILNTRFDNFFSIISFNRFAKDFIVFENLPFAAFTVVAILIAIYWRLQSEYKSRWSYCAEKYYKYIDVQLKKCQSQRSRRNPRLDMHIHDYRISVAIDILHLDLWAKRGFECFFIDAMSAAAARKPDLKEKIRLNRAGDTMITEHEAEKLLKNSFKIKD